MKLTVKTHQGPQSGDLRNWVAECAHGTLGRLTRQVSHAAVSLREHAHGSGGRVDVCTLRLHVPGDPDIVVESLRPGREAAISGAFRRARSEMERRRRTPVRTSGWAAMPLPEPA